jgi:hypothetical protein
MMKLLWLFMVACSLTGCVVQPKIDLDAFYAHRPRSIVVVPVSKYPPAKPGALCCEPLKAVRGVANAAPV